MSDIERNAAEARSELRLTEAAFDRMREEYIEQAIHATDQGGVMSAIAAARLVDDVRARLRAYIDTQAMAEAAQADQSEE